MRTAPRFSKEWKPAGSNEPLDGPVWGLPMHLLEETVRLLVERGQKTGFVTFGQVHEALSESDHDPDRLDQILTSLEEAGVSVIDDRDD